MNIMRNKTVKCITQLRHALLAGESESCLTDNISFGDDFFKAISCTGTDNQTENKQTKITKKT